MCEAGWWGREIGKRVRTLLVPFVLWSLLFVAWSIPFVVVSTLTGVSGSQQLPSGWHEWAVVFGLDPFSHPRLNPLWFIRALILLVLVSPVLKAIISRGRGWAMSFLVLAWLCTGFVPSWDVASGPWERFFKVTFSTGGLFYFSLGIFLRYWGVRRKACWASRRLAVVALLVALVGFWLTGVLLLRDIGWFPYPRWAALPLALWAVWTLVPATVWPKWLTSASFPIYLMHMFVLVFLTAASKVSEPIWVVRNSIPGYLLFAAVTVACCLAVTYCLRRYLPTLARWLFGNR